jgi:hypothetical protein
VRRVINGGDDEDIPIATILVGDDGAFSTETVDLVRGALTDAAGNAPSAAALGGAIDRLCEETRVRGHSPERMVAALKDVWRAAPRPPLVDQRRWEVIYRTALTRSLALYFDGLYE